MILFPCEACGKVICADDDSAAQQLPCPYCQKMLSVPAESAVDCCLIYQDPRHPGGQPMSSAELQEQLAAGKLRPYDLLWTKQLWRPLYQTLNLSLGVTPQNDQPEIAVRFEELAPLPGFAPLPKRGSRRKPRASHSANAALAAAASDAAKTPLAEQLKRCAFLLVALGVLLFGVVRALRIYNYATKRVSSVMLFNGTAQNLAFQFPFSGFDPTVAPVENFATRENLVVGLPCSKSLKIWGIGDNPYDQDLTQLGSPNEKLSVRIRPGHDTLVNYGNVALPIYRDLRELDADDAMAPEELRQPLASELAANAAPASARKLFDHAQETLRGHFVKTVNDLVFTDEDYNLDELRIPTGERDDSARDAQPALQECLYSPLASTRTFPQGTFVIQGAAELRALSVKLPPASCRPAPAIAFDAAGTLEITCGDDHTLHLEMPLDTSRNQALPEQYRGAWHYTAQEAPDGTWSWSWLFTSKNNSFRVAADGTVTTLK